MLTTPKLPGSGGTLGVVIGGVAGAIAAVVGTVDSDDRGRSLLRLPGRVPRNQCILSGRGLAFAPDTLGVG